MLTFFSPFFLPIGSFNDIITNNLDLYKMSCWWRISYIISCCKTRKNMKNTNTLLIKYNYSADTCQETVEARAEQIVIEILRKLLQSKPSQRLILSLNYFQFFLNLFNGFEQIANFLSFRFSWNSVGKFIIFFFSDFCDVDTVRLPVRYHLLVYRFPSWSQ